MKTKTTFKIGDTVEYTSMSTTIHTKILKIKEDGKLILDTANGSKSRVIKSDNGRYKKGQIYDLCKNVCVWPHRVKKIK